MSRREGAKAGVFTGGILDRILGVGDFAQSLAKRAVTGDFSRLTTESGHTRQVQLVTSEMDGAISNARVHFAAAALDKRLEDNAFGYCVMKEEFKHVFISPVDDFPERDQWWLDPNRIEGGRTVLQLLNDFIVDGKLFPASKTEVAEQDKFLKGDPMCDVHKVLEEEEHQQPAGVDPPWWVVHGVAPAGPDKKRNEEDGFTSKTFSPEQQEQFGVNEFGDVIDEDKHSAAIVALQPAGL